MAKVSPPSGASEEAARSHGEQRGRGMSWQTGLVLGLCFGLGYGLTHRLLPLYPMKGFQGHQQFGVKSFPGTGLGTFRESSGSPSREIRADLDRIEREKQEREQQAKEEEEMARRRESIEERERRQLESDWDTDGEIEEQEFELSPRQPADGTPSAASSRARPTTASPPSQPSLQEPPPLPDLPPVPPLPEP